MRHMLYVPAMLWPPPELNRIILSAFHRCVSEMFEKSLNRFKKKIIEKANV